MGHPAFEYPAILDESYDYIASYIGSHIQKQVTETGNNNLFLSHIKDKQHKVFHDIEEQRNFNLSAPPSLEHGFCLQDYS